MLNRKELKIRKPSGEVATIELCPSRRLGKGAYGSVFFGNVTEANVSKPLAVKVLNYLNTTVGECKQEVEIMSLFIGYPNITQVYGSAFAGNGGCDHIIAMSYAEKGSLADSLTQLSPLEQMQVMYGVANGLSYMHDKKVIHGDINTNNVVLGYNMEPRLCDFGLSKRIGIDNGLNEFFGALVYGAPELILMYFGKFGTLTTASDMYALSFLFWSVVSRAAPLPAIETAQQLHDWVVIQDKRESIPPEDQCPASVAHVIDAGWRKDPASRLSIQAVLPIMFSAFLDRAEKEKQKGDVKAQQGLDKQVGLVPYSRW